MTKQEFADEVTSYAMNLAFTEGLGEDDFRRAKLYRKAGMELISLAAQIDAERGNPTWVG